MAALSVMENLTVLFAELNVDVRKITGKSDLIIDQLDSWTSPQCSDGQVFYTCAMAAPETTRC